MILFKNIVFDEFTHTYFSRSTGQIYKSVTSSFKVFTKPFNASFWATKKSKELGVSVFEIQRQWKIASSVGSLSGNLCHLYLEALFKNKIIKPVIEIPEDCIEQVIEKFESLKPMMERFVEDHQHLDIFGSEVILHKNNLCGQADMLCLNEDKSITIYDFKTNKKLSTWDDRFLNELKHLKTHDVTKFALQLSTYQVMLESIGYKVKERIIVWLNPSNESYELINLPFLEAEANILINYDYNK